MTDPRDFRWKVTFFPQSEGLRLPETMEVDARDILAAIAAAAKALLRKGVPLADIIAAERTNPL